MISPSLAIANTYKVMLAEATPAGVKAVKLAHSAHQEAMKATQQAISNGRGAFRKSQLGDHRHAALLHTRAAKAHSDLHAIGGDPQHSQLASLHSEMASQHMKHEYHATIPGLLKAHGISENATVLENVVVPKDEDLHSHALAASSKANSKASHLAAAAAHFHAAHHYTNEQNSAQKKHGWNSPQHEVNSKMAMMHGVLSQLHVIGSTHSE